MSLLRGVVRLRSGVVGELLHERRPLRYGGKQLVETGTRNRLVHVNRKNKRAKVVNVVNAIAIVKKKESHAPSKRDESSLVVHFHLS